MLTVGLLVPVEKVPYYALWDVYWVMETELRLRYEIILKDSAPAELKNASCYARVR